MSDKLISRRGVIGAGLGALAATRLRPAGAQAFPSTWTFGEVTISKVLDMTGPFSAARAFPGADLSEMDKYADMLVPWHYEPATKNVLFDYQAFVVRTPRYVIVVDGGQGNDKPRGSSEANMRKGPFLENLKAAGVVPEQVNFVMNTHFHSDHVGWNTSTKDGKFVPTFPNARYIFNQAEVDGSRANLAAAGIGVSFADSIQPVLDANIVDFIKGDREIDNGVRIVFSPGHTPGHQALSINSKGKRAILCGDLIHNPIEVVHPEWEVLFDADKEAGKVQRHKFVDGHTDVDVTIFAAHFRGPTAGKIVSERGGKRLFKMLA